MISTARFVLLRHDCPRGLHWDFMLQAGGVLRTWALAKEPVANLTCSAEPLPDHRLAYLDYEGEVSDGRGTVTRYDRGEYLVRQDDADQVVVQLNGERLRGVASLVRERSDQRWRFSFDPDGTTANGLPVESAAGSPSVARSTVQPAINSSSSPS